MLIRKRVVSLLCAALMLMTMVYIACPTKTYAADYDQQLEEARKEQAELDTNIFRVVVSCADANDLLIFFFGNELHFEQHFQ